MYRICTKEGFKQKGKETKVNTPFYNLFKTMIISSTFGTIDSAGT